MDVYVFGAGASAAEGAPAIGDFFARAYELLAPDYDPRIQEIWRFLAALFQQEVAGPASFGAMPAIDEVISLVDWSLHLNQGLGEEYDPPRLYAIRRDLEYLLAAALDAALAAPAPAVGPHRRFVQGLLTRPDDYALLSLNYDTLLDGALVSAGLLPDYGLGEGGVVGLQRPFLGKLHGSLNWALCAACGHITVAEANRRPLLPYLERLACEACDSRRLHRLIISPTWLKNYAGFRLQPVWDRALQSLRQADRIVFVGYSAAPADVAVYQLIRRALLASPSRPRSIRVINHRRPGDSGAARQLHEAKVQERFTRLFGLDVQFDFSGFRGII